MCGNARDEKEKAEQECYSVKCKAKDLKQLLVPSVEKSHQELEHLVHDIEDCKKSMEQAEKQMQSSSSAFMAAHSATMEVLGVAGKCSINRGLVIKVWDISDACFVWWFSTVMKFVKNISSDATGQYLKLLWVFLIHVANFCMTM